MEGGIRQETERPTAWTLLEAVRGVPRAICTCTNIDAHVKYHIAETRRETGLAVSAACGTTSMRNGAGVARCINIGDCFLIGKIAFLSKGKAEVGEDDAEEEECEPGRVLRLYHRTSCLRGSAGQKHICSEVIDRKDGQ
jgi:hypothetical protein